MPLPQGKSLPSQLGCDQNSGLLTSVEGPNTTKYAGYTEMYLTLLDTTPKRAATAAISSSPKLS